MKTKLSLLLTVAVLAAVPAFAQRRSVTNMDLEKYKEKRLQAERDYQENYARMGFPSPEELKKQLEKSRVEREALAARLAAERIERERIEAERAEAARYAQDNYYLIPGGNVGGGLYYGWPGGYYSNRGYYSNPWRRGYRSYSPPISVGNGIPLVNYGPLPNGPIRQTPVRMGPGRRF